MTRGAAWLAYGAIALALGVATVRLGAQASSRATELYAIFREYRLELGTSDPEVAGYFSRSALETMLGYADRQSPAEPVLQVIQSTLLFGLEVEVIYSYRTVAPHDGQETLRIVCACRKFASGVGAIEISFVQEGGRQLINFLEFDTTVTAPPAGAVPLERFGSH